MPREHGKSFGIPQNADRTSFKHELYEANDSKLSSSGDFSSNFACVFGMIHNAIIVSFWFRRESPEKDRGLLREEITASIDPYKLYSVQTDQ
jgi:hypothetical protein